MSLIRSRSASDTRRPSLELCSRKPLTLIETWIEVLMHHVRLPLLPLSHKEPLPSQVMLCRTSSGLSVDFSASAVCGDYGMM